MSYVTTFFYCSIKIIRSQGGMKMKVYKMNGSDEEFEDEDLAIDYLM